MQFMYTVYVSVCMCVLFMNVHKPYPSPPSLLCPLRKSGQTALQSACNCCYGLLFLPPREAFPSVEDATISQMCGAHRAKRDRVKRQARSRIVEGWKRIKTQQLATRGHKSEYLEYTRKGMDGVEGGPAKNQKPQRVWWARPVGAAKWRGSFWQIYGNCRKKKKIPRCNIRVTL